MTTIVKLPSSNGSAVDVTLPPFDVRQPFLRRQHTRLVEHRRGHVDAGRLPHMRCECAHDDAAAAGDIEDRVRRAPGRAASTIIRNASALVIGAAVLNSVACR